MKIQRDHFSHLKIVLDWYVAGNPGIVDRYARGDYPRSEQTKDLQRRFCWDSLTNAGLIPFACKELYSYLDDSHIYAALRTILPKVVPVQQKPEDSDTRPVCAFCHSVLEPHATGMLCGPCDKGTE